MGTERILIKQNRSHSIPAEMIVSYAYGDGSGEQINRLVNTGGANLGYDMEGRLPDVNGTAYAFNYKDRLIGVGSTQYFYDGTGNRLKAIRNGVTTQYIYDASGHLLAEGGKRSEKDYRCQLLLKGLRAGPVHALVTRLMKVSEKAVRDDKVKVIVDVDPFSML